MALHTMQNLRTLLISMDCSEFKNVRGECEEKEFEGFTAEIPSLLDLTLQLSDKFSSPLHLDRLFWLSRRMVATNLRSATFIVRGTLDNEKDLGPYLAGSRVFPVKLEKLESFRLELYFTYELYGDHDYQMYYIDDLDAYVERVLQDVALKMPLVQNVSLVIPNISEYTIILLPEFSALRLVDITAHLTDMSVPDALQERLRSASPASSIERFSLTSLTKLCDSGPKITFSDEPQMDTNIGDTRFVWTIRHPRLGRLDWEMGKEG